jgi:hypothetical protein
VLVTGVVQLTHAGRLATLTFTPDGGESPQSVTTDDRGRYSVGLAAPGRYVVHCEAGVDDPVYRVVDVIAGENVLDVLLDAGSIRFIEPWPTATAVVDGPRGLRTFHIDQATHNDEMTGLSLGTYGIWLAASGLATKQYVTVTLDAQHRGVTVRSTLADFVRTVTEIAFEDDAGAPIGAQVLMDQSQAPAARSAGRTNATLGSPLFVRAGAVSSCAAISPPRQVVRVPQATAEIELRYRRPFLFVPADVYGRVTGIPGATCAPYLDAFIVRRAVSGLDESVFVKLPMGSLTLIVGDKKYGLVVPGQAVAIK